MCRKVSSPVLRVRALGYRERVWATGSGWRALCEIQITSRKDQSGHSSSWPPRTTSGRMPNSNGPTPPH
jgi:hypothetical protein